MSFFSDIFLTVLRIRPMVTPVPTPNANFLQAALGMSPMYTPAPPPDLADNSGTQANFDSMLKRYVNKETVVTSEAQLTSRLETKQDHDWFRMELISGYTYTFRMNKLGGDLDAFLTLRDAQGREVTHNDDSGGSRNSLVTFTADRTGVFFLDASSFASGSSGAYEIKVQTEIVHSGSETDFEYVSELTASKKHQLYRLELLAGRKYRFEMNSKEAGYFDSYLYLRDAKKNEIVHNDDRTEIDRNSEIEFTATSSGVYYLDATSYEEKCSGKYLLRSTTTHFTVL